MKETIKDIIDLKYQKVSPSTNELLSLNWDEIDYDNLINLMIATEVRHVEEIAKRNSEVMEYIDDEINGIVDVFDDMAPDIFTKYYGFPSEIIRDTINFLTEGEKSPFIRVRKGCIFYTGKYRWFNRLIYYLEKGDKEITQLFLALLKEDSDE